MSNFLTSLHKTLLHEGGYVNDPDDPGGETYRGIARNLFGQWSGWVIVDQQKKVSGFPLNLDRNVDLQQHIEAFYRTYFWEKIHGDEIEDQQVADALFDFAVNAGAGTSIALAQQVVETTADGVMGEQTLAAINSKDPEYFLAAFTVARIARYLSIVSRRPASRKFFYGWVLRTINH